MKIFNLSVSYTGTAETWDEIKNDAKNEKIKNVFIGTKEFVNVVRCKDCKHGRRYKYTDEYVECKMDIDPIDRDSDFFCADGERRSE